MCLCNTGWQRFIVYGYFMWIHITKRPTRPNILTLFRQQVQMEQFCCRAQPRPPRPRHRLSAVVNDSSDALFTPFRKHKFSSAHSHYSVRTYITAAITVIGYIHIYLYVLAGLFRGFKHVYIPIWQVRIFSFQASATLYLQTEIPFSAPSCACRLQTNYCCFNLRHFNDTWNLLRV
jgi:hypothetical protein